MMQIEKKTINYKNILRKFILKNASVFLTVCSCKMHSKLPKVINLINKYLKNNFLEIYLCNYIYLSSLFIFKNKSSINN